MGRILSEKGILSPRFAGPSEENRVPDRLKTDGEIPTWKVATQRFERFVELLEEQDITTHRALDFATFTSDWASAAWSDLYRIDAIACQWAEATAMITLAGSYWLDKESNTFLPPVTYLTRLRSSRRARQKALSRALADVEQWQSIRVYGGEGYNGYPRLFVGLYLSSPIERETLEPVLDTHVANTPIAEADAHDPEDVVNINHSPTHKSRLVHGLGQQIPGLTSREGIKSESWDKKKVATALHGGGWRPYTFGRSI